MLLAAHVLAALVLRARRAARRMLLLLLPRINVDFTLFSRVTLIGKVQSTSDLDRFHARDLPCSLAKFYDDPISNCRVDRTSVSFTCSY